MKLFAAIIFIAFLFSGCATSIFREDRIDKISEKCRTDLEGDGTRELIEVEDQSQAEKGFVLYVRDTSKDIVDYSIFDGSFSKLEVVNIKGNPEKQIALFYDDLDDLSHLAIYSLKNRKLARIFAISSRLPIETGFDTALSRIRVRKEDSEGRLSMNTENWDVWVWSGDKFIKEK